MELKNDLVRISDGISKGIMFRSAIYIMAERAHPPIPPSQPSISLFFGFNTNIQFSEDNT